MSGSVPEARTSILPRLPRVFLTSSIAPIISLSVVSLALSSGDAVMFTRVCGSTVITDAISEAALPEDEMIEASIAPDN